MASTHSDEMHENSGSEYVITPLEDSSKESPWLSVANLVSESSPIVAAAVASLNGAPVADKSNAAVTPPSLPAPQDTNTSSCPHITGGVTTSVESLPVFAGSGDTTKKAKGLQVVYGIPELLKLRKEGSRLSLRSMKLNIGVASGELRL